jgi:hypothetical protein
MLSTYTVCAQFCLKLIDLRKDARRGFPRSCKLDYSLALILVHFEMDPRGSPAFLSKSAIFRKVGHGLLALTLT